MADPMEGFPEGDADDQIEWLAREAILRGKAGDVDTAAVLDLRYTQLVNKQLTARNAALENEMQDLRQRLQGARVEKLELTSDVAVQIFVGMMKQLRQELAASCERLDLRIAQKMIAYPMVQENIAELQRRMLNMQKDLDDVVIRRQYPDAIIGESSHPAT